MLPPFTLYGLQGCSHCRSAEQFLKMRGIPFIAMLANDDPIISAGVKQMTGGEEYPVLVSRMDPKEVISRFRPDEYERITKLFYSVNSSSAPSVFDSEQQSVPQAPVQAQTAATS